MYLLDANVLIALGDPLHREHSRALLWFKAHSLEGWFTCPLTENAFVRILSSSGYPNTVSDTEVLRTLLVQLCSLPGHQFLADSVSVRDRSKFPDLSGAKHLTDQYLLSLAVDRRIRFATLDRRIRAELIPGGTDAYTVID